MSDEIIEKFEKITQTITKLHELWREEIEETKRQQEYSRKDIETLSYQIARIEKKIN